jgi:WhiB family redox-sensing transcriptional regulator
MTDLVLDIPRFAEALCAQADPELFFPEKGGSNRDGKRLCRRCQGRAECLEWAMTHQERFGIWGGTSERERRAMARTGSGLTVFGAKVAERRSDVRALTDAGFKPREIAEALGFDLATVYSDIRHNHEEALDESA